MSDAELADVGARMSNALVHRGPDDDGIWTDSEAGITLSHRRLAIVELSVHGSQPMLSASGRYVLIFNGEVYNYRALRRQLVGAGSRFRGGSDTEVLVEAIDRWGLRRAVSACNGMFAFAVWDRHRRLLHLGRDRLGEKPLYYGWSGRRFLFASELKALRVVPGFDAEVDRDSLAAYLRHNYVPTPRSIYCNVCKLPPGSTLTIDPRAPGSALRPVPYWSVRDVAERGLAAPLSAESKAIDCLDELLRDSVRLRMLADVPVGAFLSGGIDSSTVVALMQAQTSRPVKTYTLGFHENGFDEAAYAKQVARHLGTDHTELYVSAQEALDIVPRLVGIYDEPFGDSSQIPTVLISELARRDVTVSLSGDGGDELFAGYLRYSLHHCLWRTLRRYPKFARRLAGELVKRVPVPIWDSVYARTERVVPWRWRQNRVGDKLHKAAELFHHEHPEALFRHLLSHWQRPDDVVLGGQEKPTAMTDPEVGGGFASFTNQMMYLDSVMYLPDNILTKVDRGAMSVGLEARVPLLDHRVVELAWKLPLDLKLKCGKTKWLLRRLLYRYVPPGLVERPKMGFAIPLAEWLRGPLRPWAEDLLSEQRLRTEGFFDPGPIRRRWTSHQRGERDFKFELWDVLMFQAWYEHTTRDLVPSR